MYDHFVGSPVQLYPGDFPRFRLAQDAPVKIDVAHGLADCTHFKR